MCRPIPHLPAYPHAAPCQGFTAARYTVLRLKTRANPCGMEAQISKTFICRYYYYSITNPLTSAIRRPLLSLFPRKYFTRLAGPHTNTKDRNYHGIV